MRNALPPAEDGLDRSGFTCPVCQRQIVTSIDGLFDNPARGNRQRFCSPACRQAAYRRRRAAAPETAPLQPRGGRNRSLTNTTK